jgi:sugar phosphate isomerase/epimerase
MSMLHVSDTPLPATNHHLPLGLGNVDIRSCTALANAGFHGPAILEIGGLQSQEDMVEILTPP